LLAIDVKGRDTAVIAMVPARVLNLK